MYQGNVYVSFDEPQVQDNCNAYIPRQKPGHNIVTIASDQLHSIRKFPHALAEWPVKWDLIPYPVNFDDFNNPTPFSAYSGMLLCAQEGWDHALCNIVKPDTYRPYMLMPPQIRDLDPNWKSCLYDKYAVFDPPVALHTRSGMFSSVNAQPTSVQHVEPVHTPATPGHSGGDAAPGPTSKPDNTNPNQDHPGKPPAVPQGPSINHPTATPHADSSSIEQPPQSVVTIGSSVMQMDPTGGLVLDPGLSLSIGAPAITKDGTTISLGPSGIVLINGKKTRTVPLPAATPGRGQAMTLGEYTVSLDSSGVVIVEPGRTLRAGDEAVVQDDVTLSMGASVIIAIDAQGTSTISLPNIGTRKDQLITMGSQIYTVMNGRLVMGPNLTLEMSGAGAIIAGATVSLVSEGVIIRSSSRTSTIPFKSQGVGGNADAIEATAPLETPETTDSAPTSSASGIHKLSQLQLLALLAIMLAIMV